MSTKRDTPGERGGDADAVRGALGQDLDVLADLVETGREVLPAEGLLRAESVLTRARERESVASGRTVVALMGATGSGKSSVTNAVVAREVARVAARRPTTREAMACVWGADDAGALLDWLGVPQRVQVTAPGEPAVGPTGVDLSGLVLLDMPDIDSTHREHRATAARLAGAVDVLLWVLDPQKYADASVHRDFLRPMAQHARVTLVVLNQVDTLDADERAHIRADLERLLGSAGLGDVRVQGISALTGEGIEELVATLGEVSATTRAAHERLRADVRTVGHELARAAGIDPAQGGAIPTRVADADVDQLVEASTAAAGVRAVTGAVEKAYRHRASARVTWPPLRPLRKLRSDPVGDLHLDREVLDPELVRSSLPAATPVQEAGVRRAAHGMSMRAGEVLPDAWHARLVEETQARVPATIENLDRSVVGTNTENGVRPRWWSLVGALHWLALLTAIAGLAWLAVLLVAGYFLIRLEPPYWGPVPVPTALAVLGVLAGLLLWWLGAAAARVGARRRARRVGRRIRHSVDTAVRAQLVAPVEDDLARYSRLRDLLARLVRG